MASYHFYLSSWWLWCQVPRRVPCQSSQESTWTILRNLYRLVWRAILWNHPRLELQKRLCQHLHAWLHSKGTQQVSTSQTKTTTRCTFQIPTNQLLCNSPKSWCGYLPSYFKRKDPSHPRCSWYTTLLRLSSQPNPPCYTQQNRITSIIRHWRRSSKCNATPRLRSYPPQRRCTLRSKWYGIKSAFWCILSLWTQSKKPSRRPLLARKQK